VQHYNANKKKPKTNNQNKKIETTLPPFLNEALLFKGKRVREGGTKENNLTRLGAECTQAMWPRNNRGT